jgi:hypothetical protein
LSEYSWVYEYIFSVGTSSVQIIPGSGSDSPKTKYRVQNRDLEHSILIYFSDVSPGIGLELPPLGVVEESGDRIHQGSVMASSPSGNTVNVYGAYN